MQKIRFFNAKLLLPDMSVRDGEVFINNDIITAVNTSDNGQSSFNTADTSIDCHGGLLMPGFCDAHTHSAMTFLRSQADDLPLDRWLNESVFPREALLTPDDVYIMTRLAVLEYLSSGITSCFDMYFHRQSIVDALSDSGFRGVLCGAATAGDNIEDMEDCYEKYNGKNPLISFRIGFHAEYTADKKLLEEISALAKKYHAPVFSHSSETEKEVRECKERHGMTPTVYFESLGLYNYGGGGFHCVHMTEEDMEIYRKRGLYAITNPASNSKLASGIAPLYEMYNKGIKLAVGTDGPASNNALDMFREIYLAAVLQKLRCNDASAMPAKAVLKAALSGGADAMGINSGRLVPGRFADLVLIDLESPNMQPLNNIAENIVYSGSKSNVRMTVVGGKILYRDGEFFIGEEPAVIYEKAAAAVKRISEKL